MSRRVLYIIGSGNIGGRERQLQRLATELAATGWQPGVAFLTGGGPVADALRAAGIPVWLPAAGRGSGPTATGAGTFGSGTVGSGTVAAAGGAAASAPTSRLRRRLNGIRRLGASIRTLRRAARAHRPDVVHAMLPTSVWLGLPALTAVRPLRRPRPRRVAGIYGFTPPMHPLVARSYRRQLRHAHAVVANAPHLLDEAQRDVGVAPDRLHLLANGVDLPAAADLPAIAASAADLPAAADLPTEVADVPAATAPVAVMVANFHAYKGHADLVHALALLPADIEVTVRLCGTGAERPAMQALAAQLGVVDRVVFVDPPADVPAELATAQFAIHPSHTEGLSNAILEQLAAGLPVVACRVGGNPVLVADRVNGLLVPPADPAALAAAIATLATDANLRAQMAIAARTSAERFAWPACTQAHAELYDQLFTEAPR